MFKTFFLSSLGGESRYLDHSKQLYDDITWISTIRWIISVVEGSACVEDESSRTFYLDNDEFP